MSAQRKFSKSLSSFRNDKKGTTAIAMAILTPVIVAGLAFGSEAGMWEMTKRKLQNATDAAGFAAGTQLRSGLTEEDMRKAAMLIANDSGFKLIRHDETDADAKAGADGTLALFSPPVSGPYSTRSDAKNFIQIATSVTVDRKFSKLFMSNDVVINNEAIIGVQSGRPACVLSLDPTADDAVAVAGSADVALSGCDVAANSISPSAFAQQGNGALATSCISVVGNVDYNRQTNVSFSDPECSEAIQNAPVTADPYKDRAFPVDPATMACETGQSANAWTKNNGKVDTGKKYCNGANVSGTVTVQIASSADPWIILDGGSWKFNANSDFTAEGVTIFLTGGADLAINGGADFRVKAPTSGSLSGLAIFVDRTETQEYKFNGGANIEIVGAIYAPNAKVTMNGSVDSSSAGECNQVIGGRVEFTGSASFDTDCSSSGTASIKVAESIQILE